MTAIDFTTCRTSAAGNIITPKCRMSFPTLHEPVAPQDKPEGKKKYSVALLIPPGSNLELLAAMANAAAQDKWGDKKPTKMKKPFLKAEDYDYKGYDAGWMLIRATTLNKPGLVDATGQNIDSSDTTEVYAGRWCVASLRAFAYDVSGNRGISFGLQNIQLLDHDESLGGRARAEEEFAPVAAPDGGAVNSMDDLVG